MRQLCHGPYLIQGICIAGLVLKADVAISIGTGAPQKCNIYALGRLVPQQFLVLQPDQVHHVCLHTCTGLDMTLYECLEQTAAVCGTWSG